MTRVGEVERHKAALLTAFVHHMGSEVVDAAKLTGDVR